MPSLMRSAAASLAGLRCRLAGQPYFGMVPDYWIRVVDIVLQEGCVVALFGRAGGSCAPSGGSSPKRRAARPSGWLAEVRGVRMAGWRGADKLPLCS